MRSSAPEKILVAEDHPLILFGIKHLLQEVLPNANISHTFNFSKTLKTIEAETFGLLILDIGIPGGGRVDMIYAIRRICPALPILINSSFEERLYAMPYIRAGANGFISKSSFENDFKEAVQTVLEGKIYASQTVIQNALETNQGFSSLISKLTDRELDIAKLLSAGLSTSEISSLVNLSTPSVSNYKTRIFEKLSLRNVVQLNELLQANGI